MHGGTSSANRKPRRAALFRAVVQQSERDRDRCICQCQTRLWRWPVSGNIHWSLTIQIRYWLIDGSLSIYIHWGRRVSVHLCCLSHPAKTLVPVFGCCLGTEEGQLVEQQYEEVTFSLSIWNPLRSYCARSSFVGTSGNIFWLNAGGKGAEDTDWGRRKRRTVKIYRVLVNRLPHWKTSWPRWLTWHMKGYTC